MYVSKLNLNICTYLCAVLAQAWSIMTWIKAFIHVQTSLVLFRTELEQYVFVIPYQPL